MKHDFSGGRFMSPVIKYLLVGNLAVFGCFYLYFDAIEMPNHLGYITLCLAGLASVTFYLKHNLNSGTLLNIALVVWFGLGLIAHNINFLLLWEAREYRVESKRPVHYDSESWTLSTKFGETIVVRVHRFPSKGEARLQLQRGLFGVHCGKWRDDTDT